jgi:hypothetical protein
MRTTSHATSHYFWVALSCRYSLFLTLFYPSAQRPLQISLASIVTLSRASSSKSLHLLELPAQTPVYRAAGDVSLTATFAESPFLAANIAPATLSQVHCTCLQQQHLTNFKRVLLWLFLQNLKDAFASNSSNAFYVTLGIVSLKVVDPSSPADAAAAEEAAQKSQVTLAFDMRVACLVARWLPLSPPSRTQMQSRRSAVKTFAFAASSLRV